MKKKGFRHFHTLEAIREYSQLSPKHKLEWLEEANRFSYLAVTGKRRKIWEMFRQGKI